MCLFTHSSIYLFIFANVIERISLFLSMVHEIISLVSLPCVPTFPLPESWLFFLIPTLIIIHQLTAGHGRGPLSVLSFPFCILHPLVLPRPPILHHRLLSLSHRTPPVICLLHCLLLEELFPPSLLLSPPHYLPPSPPGHPSPPPSSQAHVNWFSLCVMQMFGLVSVAFLDGIHFAFNKTDSDAVCSHGPDPFWPAVVSSEWVAIDSANKERFGGGLKLPQALGKVRLLIKSHTTVK